ncbi:hypothetical protein PspMM1_16440 [Pseudoalteromonas sp. MM1]|nr:hypothetical protein PspMM1_16440 [Pseudoalteromonas sp. MM1]
MLGVILVLMVIKMQSTKPLDNQGGNTIKIPASFVNYAYVIVLHLGFDMV